MQEKTIDNIVIGAGSGGLAVAVGLAKIGKQVALIEKGRIGGECTNTGCVPSKALIHASFLQQTNPQLKPLEYVRSRIDLIRKEESPQEISQLGIKVIFGQAKFLDNHTIQIISNSDSKSKSQVIKASKIVIATGSSPRIISVPGLPQDNLLTNENIFQLKKIPRKLVILGVGPVSCELAIAFFRLGTQVHILHRGKSILKNYSSDSTSLILHSMEKLGIQFHWQVSQIKWHPGKKPYVSFLSDKQSQKITQPDYFFQAIGRQPNINNLGLKNTDIYYSRQGIHTDKYFRTSLKHIYAIGDVTNGPKYTHLAYAQAQSVVQSIAFPWLPKKIITTIPSVTYTSPQIASTGLPLTEIDNINPHLYRTYTVELKNTDIGKIKCIHQGRIKIWVKIITGQILRVEIVADQAGEMISQFTLALDNKLTLWKLRNSINPYPTYSFGYRHLYNQFLSDIFTNWKTHLHDFVKFNLKKFFNHHIHKILVITFWLATIVGVRGYVSSQGLTFIQAAKILTEFIQNNPTGVGLFILITSIRPLIFFPAGWPALLAGHIYSLHWGFLYALIGGTVSAVFPFVAGRWLSSKSKPQTQLPTGFSAYVKKIKHHPFQTTLTMRLLYLPYDAVSLVAGAVKAKAVPFFIATIIGNIIGTFTFVSLGASVTGDIFTLDVQFNSQILILSFIMIIITLFSPKLYRYFRSKK